MLTVRYRSVAGATNPDVEYRREIFEGVFLQWQSTLVHGCFLAVGLFALGLIRVKAPKLMLLSIFASIVLDIMVSEASLPVLASRLTRFLRCSARTARTSQLHSTHLRRPS